LTVLSHQKLTELSDEKGKMCATRAIPTVLCVWEHL
jgi:hypothetical protein